MHCGIQYIAIKYRVTLRKWGEKTLIELILFTFSLNHTRRVREHQYLIQSQTVDSFKMRIFIRISCISALKWYSPARGPSHFLFVVGRYLPTRDNAVARNTHPDALYHHSPSWMVFSLATTTSTGHGRCQHVPYRPFWPHNVNVCYQASSKGES